MNRTLSYDELLARYWQWLLERFRQGTTLEYSPREVSPGKGNPRRVEYMDEEVIRLRKTTSRGLHGTCLMTQLRDEFWKLCQDPEVENKPLSLLRQQYGIKNFVEFKRHMFEEFRQFARGSPDLQSALVGTATAGLSDGAIDQAIRSPGLHIGIIPPDSQAMSAGEALQNKARSQGTTKNPRDVPPGLRLRVYERDRFRCVYCGRSPITELAVELHVDHIVPFVRGGKTVLENLQTLCAQCNLGKGSRDDVRHPGA
jgi:hypothetical protein